MTDVLPRFVAGVRSRARRTARLAPGPRYDSSRIWRRHEIMALLTVRAAADRMGIGYSTLKQWIHRGKIRTTTTAGGHHRLSEAEVDRLLAPQTHSAGARRRDAAGPPRLIVS